MTATAGSGGAAHGSGGSGVVDDTKSRIVHGDAADVLSKMPAESVRCVCTDPPYGVMVARHDWDSKIPGSKVWRECVRVMEPGAFAFVMCSPRQDITARMISALAGAGLDMSYPPVLWTYATGFPAAKSVEVIKRRFGRSSASGGGADRGGPDADGSYIGYVPRPAVEFVLVGMRPTRDRVPLIDQYMENGLGVTHLDDCRIPYATDMDKKLTSAGYYVPADVGGPYPPGSVLSRDGKKVRVPGKVDDRGRFPSNLLCSGGALDDGRPHGMAKGSFARYFDLDAWAAEHVTLAVTSAPKPRNKERENGLNTGRIDQMPAGGRGRRGGAGVSGRGTGKAASPPPPPSSSSSSDAATPYNRNKRLRLNNHPAVKPIALFAYLFHLGSRPGDTVLDPFAGTGTSLLAANMTGRTCIGIEMTERYVDIARERIANCTMDTRLGAYRQ